MSARYVVVKNRNRLDLPLEMLTYLGASDERGLTGQGFGTKFAAGVALNEGLELVRASDDENGSYIAIFTSEPKLIRERVEQEIVLLVERHGASDLESIRTKMLVRMATNGWGENPLGNEYAVLREIVLDAADEDPRFTIDTADEVTFAPKGETWTYLTLSPAVKHIVDHYSYYFKQNNSVTWVDDCVGFTEPTADGETRMFITTKKSHISYVAWSSSIADRDRHENQGAFDYVLAENEQRKFASLPKRILESTQMAFRVIETAASGGSNLGFSRGVVANAVAGGFEARLDFGYHLTIPREVAINLADAPIAVRHSADAVEAEQSGKRLFYVPSNMYRALEMAGALTAHAALHKNDSGMMPLNETEQELVAEALAYLEERLSVSDPGDHLFMVCSDDKRGNHDPNYGGYDVIGLNMQHFIVQDNPVVEIARTLLHEFAHHVEGGGFMSEYSHSLKYIRCLIEMVVK